MESKYDESGAEPNDRGTMNVDPMQASQALADLASDQAATLKAAIPPRGMVAGMSCCLGAIIAVHGIAYVPIQILLTWVAVAIEVVLLVRCSRHKTVRAATRWGSLWPLRPGLLLPLIWVVLIIIAACFVNNPPLAWWMCVGLGVIAAAVSYVVVRWTWQEWVTWSGRQSAPREQRR